MRTQLLVTSSVVGLTMIAAGGTASTAAPSGPAGAQVQRAGTASALPHYKVHTFALDDDLSSTYGMVSGNGTYFANNYTSTYVYNTKTGKQIGKIDGSETSTYAVDNAGNVVGVGQSDGTKLTPAGNETAFIWQRGHLRLVNPVESIAKAGCGGPSDETTGFNWVSPGGHIVGYEGWTCNGVFSRVALGDSAAGGAKPKAIGQNGSDATKPAAAIYSSDSGLVFGTASDGLVEWTGTKPPVSVAAKYHLPNLETTPAGRFFSPSGDFLGYNGDTKGGTEFIHAGHVDHVAPDGSDFTPQGVGPNIVVGYKGSGGVAEIWTPASGLRTLQSLSTAPGLYLTTAIAVDAKGDVFGVAGARNGKSYYYEAVRQVPGPTVTISTPKSGRSYAKGATVKASYSCKPPIGHTLKSCKGSVANHAKIATGKVGKHTFTVVGTDTDGGTTTKKVHYSIKR